MATGVGGRRSWNGGFAKGDLTCGGARDAPLFFKTAVEPNTLTTGNRLPHVAKTNPGGGGGGVGRGEEEGKIIEGT